MIKQVVTLLLICSCAVVATDLGSAQGWKRTSYPLIGESSGVCRSKSNRLCDPDSILNDDGVAQIDALLEVPRDMLLPLDCSVTPEPSSPKLCENGLSIAPLEIAVALAKKMDLADYLNMDNAKEKAAEDFAVYLHNTWGVGKKTSCGGTGVLIFLSELDRSIYISRGDALAHVLTNARIDRAMEHMKPLLQKGNFTGALQHVVGEIEFLLDHGKPNARERIGDWMANYGGLLWILGIFGFTGIQARRRARKKREYAQLTSQLTELDEARARALQGQFQATSCPICLEPFPTAEVVGENEALIQQGSDGKPLKLLRCGHVFDTTCWDEWVASGRGQIDKCPICKENVGSNNSRSAVEQASVSQTYTTRTEISEEFEDNETDQFTHQNHEHTMEQYRRERTFRIRRLALRHPGILQQHLVDRWCSPTFNGQMAGDTEFVRRDPESSTREFSSSSEGNSFSGGVSGGGRGTSW